VPDEVRFLLDEHVSAAVVVGLKQKGIEAATAHEIGRRGYSDLEQVQFAASEGWVLVTFDPDYLAIAKSELQHAGIVWCAARKYSIGQLIRALALIHAVMDRDKMRNHVEFL
jgi:predicted nuclease of predicted toxin-antitoxin system